MRVHACTTVNEYVNQISFFTEILEQPAAIGNIIHFYSAPEGMELLRKTREAIAQRNIHDVVFTGMGSSFFISFAAASLFNQQGIHAHYINTSELLHYNLSLLNRPTLLVCASQSGESYEIKEVLEHLPAVGVLRRHCQRGG